ncbi:hypothetical protein AMATHDRAFT_150439 [Amanita thiersii Skay4041]|uniref:Golgi to ER traffic protein 2 n=1 Tax=Amanita thiersii Skay4041 TaxID=703135 RepID=A0A2A9NFX1_9AGAR|nr:hypothetical protein AMATHDRAFT_150439 [Amanita thiersii Skay4041]
MSTPAERAEARRKAILGRKSDRLAKLTTTARGEDATYLTDDSQASHNAGLRNFVGEDSPAMNMPAPIGMDGIRKSPSPAPPSLTSSSTSRPMDPTPETSFEGIMPDPNVWSPEVQRRFMQALLAGSQPSDALPEQMHPRMRKISGNEGRQAESREGSIPPFDDAMMSTLLSNSMKFDGMRKPSGVQEESKPRTVFQKLVPVMHMLGMWALLLWFIMWRQGEYSLHSQSSSLNESANLRFWEVWANLSKRAPPQLESISERTGVNFFWAFVTLQVVLHSIRLFSGFDALQPPTLLAIALPHLPQQLSSIVVNGLRYLKMGSMLLDDIAWLVVGLGFLVYIATWFTT